MECNYRDGCARQRRECTGRRECKTEYGGLQDRAGSEIRSRGCKISQGLELHGAESRECTDQEVGSVLGGEYFERFVSGIQWAAQGVGSSLSWESRE